MSRAHVCWFVLALLVARAHGQDEVVLNDGAKLGGRVVFENDEQLVLRERSKDRVVRAQEIRSVRSLERSLAEVLARLDDGLPSQPDACADLARFAAGRGLDGEAELLWWAVLTMDPEHRAAHEALGHRAVAGGWQVRSSKSWQPFATVREARADWANAWIWRSSHYQVKTNVAPEAGIAAVLDLERLRTAFQGGFGQALELRVPDAPMNAEIHGDSKSYPNPGDGRLAFYDSAQRVLHVDAQHGVRRDRVFHEGTHQLLHLTAEYGPKAKGVIPGWLHEGLAEYMAAAGASRAGATRFRLGERDSRLYVLHANDPDAYDLSRVLSFDSADFLASSRSMLKYAQAYTLVDFLLHGHGESHRDGFFRFLRAAYAGHSTSTDFKAAFAPSSANEQEVERDWTEWVRGVARGTR